MQIDGDDPDDEQPAPQAPAAEEAAAEAAPAAETEQVSDTGDIEEAWSVLRRDGFSKDDLAALSDEAIARLAAHRKKVQTDVDRKLSEAKQPQPSEADEESRQQPEEPAVAEATPKDVTDDHLQNAARMFAEAVDLDDESTSLLAASYAAVVEPFKQQLAGMQEWMARQQVEATRQQLVEQYPQVSDPNSEGFGRVVGRMTKLAEWRTLLRLSSARSCANRPKRPKILFVLTDLMASRHVLTALCLLPIRTPLNSRTRFSPSWRVGLLTHGNAHAG
jgi:hypothetical protein